MSCFPCFTILFKLLMYLSKIFHVVPKCDLGKCFFSIYVVPRSDVHRCATPFFCSWWRNVRKKYRTEQKNSCYIQWHTFCHGCASVSAISCNVLHYCFWAFLLIGNACHVGRIWFDRVGAKNFSIARFCIHNRHDQSENSKRNSLMGQLLCIGCIKAGNLNM